MGKREAQACMNASGPALTDYAKHYMIIAGFVIEKEMRECIVLMQEK